MRAVAWPVALTVAGSDSSGGAGLQADLKTFAALEVYGATAVTAVTSQNTQGVRDVHLVPPEMVTAQIEAVLDDLPVAAIKTGMLGGKDQLAAVAERLSTLRGVPLIVDPVILATSGHRLLVPDALANMVNDLIPLATLVTPNLAEAAQLTGVPDLPAQDQAQILMERGARAVLVTGGDVDGDMVEDFFKTRESKRIYRRRRVETTCTHGTGCTLSAAITAGLAAGRDLESSVTAGIEFVHRALQAAWPLGHGHGPVHHMFSSWKETS